MNLYAVDLTLQIMLKELQGQQSFLSKKLYEELVNRIEERRTCYSDVLQYLYDPSSLYSFDFGVFNISNNALVARTIVKLIECEKSENCEINDSDLPSIRSQNFQNQN